MYYVSIISRKNTCFVVVFFSYSIVFISACDLEIGLGFTWFVNIKQK